MGQNVLTRNLVVEQAAVRSRDDVPIGS